MRLRLRILEGDGSVRRILWRADQDLNAPSTTIRQLLKQVERDVGLQTGTTKGPPGPVMEVGGYECLGHFLAAELLKEDDEVTIRPGGLQDLAIDEASASSTPDSEYYSCRGTEREDDTSLRSDGPAITDLVLRNPRQDTSSSVCSDTSDESPRSTTDDSNEGHDFLRRYPRGQVAMNYHHDHLLHQQWPEVSPPPLRSGKCQVCPRRRSRSAPKLQQIEAFAAQCFYCEVVLEVTKAHLGSEPLPKYLQWFRDPRYRFRIPCDIHNLESGEDFAAERQACCPELFVPREDENTFNDFPVRGATSADTGAEEAWLRALPWIQDCLAFHQRCEKNTESPLPRRVLDLVAPSAKDSLRLCEAGEEAGRYLCLSHCWGDSEYSAKTTRLTLEQNKDNIPWDTLPKTFQDAIVFARWLGIRYLWIDSLCIIQDSNEDWLEESAKMVDIYRGAFLTLAATASPSDGGGLFHTRAPADHTRRVFGYTSGGMPYNFYVRLAIEHCTIRRHSFYLTTPKDFPLLSRAWVYQEILLSPRVIHFTERELTWECMECLDCECGSAKEERLSGDMPHKAHHSWALQESSDSHELHARWRTIVEQYSGLSLTLGKDKLPALSGLAKQMQRYRVGDQYLAGLWTETLWEDLLWYTMGKWKVSHDESEWRAPTWSWASVGAGVRYTVSGRDRCTEIYATMAHARAVPVMAGDSTGQLSSAEMVFQGRLIPGTWFDRIAPSHRIICLYLKIGSGNASCKAWNTHLDDFEWPEVYYPRYMYAGSVAVCDGTIPHRDRPSYIVTGANTQVFCLPITQHALHYSDGVTDHYLLLTPVNAGVGDGDMVYKRIGLANVSREPGDFVFADWPVTRFTFV